MNEFCPRRSQDSCTICSIKYTLVFLSLQVDEAVWAGNLNTRSFRNIMSISVLLLPTWGVKVMPFTSGLLYISATNETLATETFGMRYSARVMEGHTSNQT
jgi:hypothetical protein